tara:strand:+ start:342 stop:635 length:294 start_codon:yes stop_codon:yes gene_type:complete
LESDEKLIYFSSDPKFPTIIIPTKKVKSNTGFNEETYVLRAKGLKKLVHNSRSFVFEFKDKDLKTIISELINKSINQHSLQADKLLEKYFEKSVMTT